MPATIARPDGRRPARKRFGQHFLEPAWVEKLIRAIAPGSSDTFLEIGPGPGALTRPLTAAAARVVAFEIDRLLAEDLRVASVPNLTVVEGDFLEASIETIQNALRPEHASALRVAGNLPYNVASPILFKLVDLYAAGLPLSDATVMLQREVADRLLARPGSKDYGVLAVMLGHWAEVDRVLALPPGAFRPAPKVHSSVVRLRFHPAQPPAADEAVFRALTQAVFTRRRKTLTNALLAYPPSSQLRPVDALTRAGIDGRRRPETLEIAEFVRLADVFASLGRGSA
jgi:16S rRNA (adenine1518-N6/adenine1519-N6)-dimethyltransferase